ncbi:septum formation family protein [Actinotalea sp. M2MS4P-6]|uniref:septum formation family protein n=1 Tax=Actinotalea sp. M2MS4P-6 TaxID=2983762 RepID=UPI0021E375C7|nr:septum formation family protein [Actinotalea sp. M2MS4P-6]MCV2395365.1 septum formation family protein [Actinotalea sp. M2MS4P-6]
MQPPQGQQGTQLPGGYAAPYYAPGWQAPVSPPPAKRDGARIALRVIAIAAAVVLVVGSVAAARFWLGTRPLGDVTSPATVAAGRLSTGHCIEQLPVDGQVSSVRVVPCDQPHDAEVVGVLPFTEQDWPGATDVTDRLVAWCEMDNAEVALGMQPVVWAPTQRSWSQGDRSGLCLAWQPTGTVTGSFTAGDDVATR